MICEDCLLHHVIRECLWDVIERKHTDTEGPSDPLHLHKTIGLGTDMTASLWRTTHFLTQPPAITEGNFKRMFVNTCKLHGHMYVYMYISNHN
jgi:hypothetical protein